MIYIIGAGAIGKALAVCLQKNQQEVMLLRGSTNEPGSKSQNIELEMDNGVRVSAEVGINVLGNMDALNGIVVLANKSFGNEKLAQDLKGKVNRSPLVIMQNGLGVEQPFLEKGFPEVYRCVLFATSQFSSPTQLRYRPVSISPIGTISGNATSLEKIVQQLNSPLFPFRMESNIQPIIWKKTITNCVFNSICPLLEVDNGIFHRNEQVLRIASRVIEECVGIAQAEAVQLTTQEVEESLLMISRFSDGQLISTLQDIRNKKPTELDTLNFAIANIAEKLNLTDLVQETKLLGELTKLKSDLSR